MPEQQTVPKVRRCRQCGKDLDALGLHERAWYCSIACGDKAKRVRKRARYEKLARRASHIAA